MPKRRRKAEDGAEPDREQTAAEQAVATAFEQKLLNAVHGERQKLHQIRLACGNFRRITDPGPDHVHKFVKRIFDIVGERGA